MSIGLQCLARPTGYSMGLRGWEGKGTVTLKLLTALPGIEMV